MTGESPHTSGTMASRSDVSEVLSQCRWSEEGSYLGEVVKGSKFPVLVKVLRGQYQNLGQPSFAPNPSLISYLLLVSAGRQLSIAAQCVKFKNQRSRVVPFGPTLAIPRDYQGHFEILSEDGKSAPSLLSVEMLLHKFPDSCLVREPIKAYRSAATNKPGSVTELMTGGIEGSLSHHFRISEKTILLGVGQVLILVGEVSVPSGKNKVGRFLQCFDSTGQTVYLSLSQKGKFSPLARHDSISGVHTTKNILNKRMPMMVRLVDGKPPVGPPSSKSTSFKFLPELRLYSTIQEELIFAMPLSQTSKDSWVIPLPLSVPLKFQVCRNMEELDQTKEFCRLHEKIKNLVDQAKNLIQIYDINLKKELRFDGRQWKAYTPPIYLSSSQPLLACSASDPSPASHLVPSDPAYHNYEVPDVQDYEDIDEIYDYVRGVKPSPPPPQTILQPQPVTGNTTLITVSLTTTTTTKAEIPSGETQKVTQLGTTHPMTGGGNEPPEPPPIETIPTHKPKLVGMSSNGSKGSRHVTMVMTGNHHYHAPHHQKQLGSTGSSPNNTSSTSAGSGGEDSRRVKRKHLYVKKQSVGSGGSQNNLLEGGVNLSGSPSNRILFRRSPIFDFRYKSMNDLNRSSLDRTSSGQSNVVRYFQSSPGGYNPHHLHHHQHHRHSSNNLLNGILPAPPPPLLGRGNAAKGILRPKSLTNIFSSWDDGHLNSPPPHQPTDIFRKLRRKSQQQPKLYL